MGLEEVCWAENKDHDGGAAGQLHDLDGGRLHGRHVEGHDDVAQGHLEVDRSCRQALHGTALLAPLLGGFQEEVGFHC